MSGALLEGVGLFSVGSAGVGTGLGGGDCLGEFSLAGGVANTFAEVGVGGVARSPKEATNATSGGTRLRGHFASLRLVRALV